MGAKGETKEHSVSVVANTSSPLTAEDVSEIQKLAGAARVASSHNVRMILLKGGSRITLKIEGEEGELNELLKCLDDLKIKVAS